MKSDKVVERMKDIFMEERGFTLIEVILSLAILGILSISMISLFSFHFQSIFTMGYKSEEVFSAQSKIERELYDEGFQLDETEKEEKEVTITGDIETEITGEMLKVLQEYPLTNQAEGRIEIRYFHIPEEE